MPQNHQRPSLDAAAADEALSLVRHHAVAIAACQRIIGGQLVKQGMHVAQAKVKLPAAMFAAWLADVGLSPESAGLLSRVAELFGPHENADQIHPGAMLALAAADAPPSAIAEAKLFSQRGRIVTHALAHELLERHAESVSD